MSAGTSSSPASAISSSETMRSASRSPGGWPNDRSRRVRVVDFGIRGLDLAYTLLDANQAVILVDAIPRGGRPRTLYALEPDLDAADAPDAPAPLMEPHALDPWKVLHLARSLGGKIERVVLVGCEPQPLAAEEMQMEMSEPVQAAVGEAIRLIEGLVTQIRANGSLRPIQPGGQPEK